ncbi:hypothetical protein PAAG_12247 [Paracoccidioides lutzii Pb01]|uniref:Uncharacterized protein n=1 Tax=Paracoccidioides lutzii (strain ATCC MYA-826 / Pb01) TaxID=502779 RepID=A0A0A2VJI6_PARBA|nr:hypothetical protein PAAG_12247 [Paracoccidioides lutzii Pb01]KGQ01054.1 hypothetical protein PAAG_12247 [Paracoccidioides lutzii Pb01]
MLALFSRKFGQQNVQDSKTTPLENGACRYDGPIRGQLIYEYLCNCVIKSHHTDGSAVAIKFSKQRASFQQREVEMMDYVHSQNTAIWVAVDPGTANLDQGAKTFDTSEAVRVKHASVYLDVSTANKPAIHTKEWKTNLWDRSIQEAKIDDGVPRV